MLDYFPEAKSIKLEEIELTEDKEFWYVTLSYYETKNPPEENSNNLSNFKKKYLKFKIENETYIVFYMKTREFKTPL
ncbi:hypothetical protein FDT66_00705 [Polaribacter aestuariivivens]|uniref:Uncharacterized protein n=1 Tax=Polaribacter aestuariivivens TaxID=2304626 RepID=A0A5S3NA82_9FLAO|nr:hypothetical protein [Polaribacter aestuariivivens]TMM32017.1 hypothetical protein FDT66_00705 [Polaribacter aestuariivivens]